MKFNKVNNLACPIDGLNLDIYDKQWVCANGHTFDIARQGYVNLLPVQQKRSKHPGDSKAMVVARTHFLDSGFYQPLADKISAVVEMLTMGNTNLCLLDAGCGEGYYLNYLCKTLSQSTQDMSLSLVGLDISKEAIIQSSKRNKDITWVVGTNRQPPIVESSVDIILCVFGFVSFDGFNKVLKPGGKLILVDPGPDHLQELREIIYKKTKPSDTENGKALDTNVFSLINSQQCTFKTGNINNKDINNLLIMTPHLFRASKEGKQLAATLEKLDLTVDVNIKTLVKQ
ncbi:MAG: methyltransferase domain-containing protein [Gammaproteobacteria bacterium]|nr:methyltransferase domain-containing protein [Gammaproteobacteria bacterium]